LEPPQNLELEETTPTTNFHALVGMNTPQTLNIEGYIKNKKVIMLIDFGNTINFINYKLAKLLNRFVFLVPKFQVIISNGGTLKFSRKSHNVNINMVGFFIGYFHDWNLNG